MATILGNAIYWFSEILILLLCVRAILSWFVQSGNQTVRKLYMISYNLTEPLVSPIRQFMMRFNTGMIDFSVLIAYFMIKIVTSILIHLVYLIF